jgi:hypothetical protein
MEPETRDNLEIAHGLHRLRAPDQRRREQSIGVMILRHPGHLTMSLRHGPAAEPEL